MSKKLTEKVSGVLCGDSYCEICKETIPMKEGIKFHNKTHHARYEQGEKAGRKAEAARVLERAEKYFEENPNVPFVAYNIGVFKKLVEGGIGTSHSAGSGSDKEIEKLIKGEK